MAQNWLEIKGVGFSRSELNVLTLIDEGLFLKKFIGRVRPAHHEYVNDVAQGAPYSFDVF
jgi:hypothetical protein